jgi:putative hydrolase of the HAD superfamily
MNRLKAVIFDFGNTLVTTPALGPLLRDVFQHPLADQIGAEIDRLINQLYTYDQVVQPKWEVVWQQAFNKFNVEYCEETAIAHLNLFADKCEPLEQTLTLLKTLQTFPVKLALLSNVTGPPYIFNCALRRLEMVSYFDVVCWSSDIGFRKPSKEAYATVLEKLGVNAEITLMVGDSELADIQGAMNLGMKTILMTQKSNPKTLADAICRPKDMLSEILQFVEADS